MIERVEPYLEEFYKITFTSTSYDFKGRMLKVVNFWKGSTYQNLVLVLCFEIEMNVVDCVRMKMRQRKNDKNAPSMKGCVIVQASVMR